MRSLSSNILLVLGLSFFAMTSAASVAGGPRPLVLATQERPPYTHSTENGSIDGIAMRVVSCVLSRMERTYSVGIYPWERAQRLTQAGQIDGFFPAVIAPERASWAEASEPIADQKWVWYLPRDSKLDPLSQDFKTVAKVGAIFGSMRLKTLQTEGYQVVLRPQSEEALLMTFAAGRADAILGGDLSMKYALDKLGLDPDRFRAVTMRDAPVRAYFSREFLRTEPNFLKEFNGKIPACRLAHD